MYYSQHNWIGENEITKQKYIYILASNPEKRTQNQAQKDMKEWNDTKCTI